MICRTIHLVREATISDSLAAVVDFPAEQNIGAVKPAELTHCGSCPPVGVTHFPLNAMNRQDRLCFLLPGDRVSESKPSFSSDREFRLS